MLVLLHGFGGRPEAFHSMLGHLPSDAEVLVAALPGHDPGFPISAEWRFHDAVEVLLQRLPPRFDLLGYSMGARLALAIAIAHPERVHRLGLLGVHPGIEDAAERAERRASDRRWADLLRDRGLAGFFPSWDENPLFGGRVNASPEQHAAMTRWRAQHDPAQLAFAMEILGLGAMPNFKPRLRELSQQTQLIVGALDSKFREIAEELVKLIPRASLHVVPNAGHDVPFEAPASLAALTREFYLRN